MAHEHNASDEINEFDVGAAVVVLSFSAIGKQENCGRPSASMSHKFCFPLVFVSVWGLT